MSPDDVASIRSDHPHDLGYRTGMVEEREELMLGCSRILIKKKVVPLSLEGL
jgi:hypothetical protein